MPKKPERPSRLTTGQLSARLNVTQETLENWRYLKRGPKFITAANRRVYYRLSDVERWERRTGRNTDRGKDGT